MRVRKVAMLIFLAISFSRLLFAQDRPEQITITTYYPSPNGVYDDLRAQHMAIGETYFDHVQFCWETTGCTTQIAERADLVVEGKVGIGTVNPDGDGAAVPENGARLDVEVPLADVQATGFPGTVRRGGILLGRATVARQNPRSTFQRFFPDQYFGQEISWDSDYLGLLLMDRDGVEGGDDKDAVIAWGDNPAASGPDALRFQFSSSTGTTAPNIFEAMALVPRRVVSAGITTDMIDVAIGTDTLDATLVPRLQIQGATADNSASALYVTDSAATPNPLFLVRNNAHVSINTDMDSGMHLTVLNSSPTGYDNTAAFFGWEADVPVGLSLGRINALSSAAIGVVGTTHNWVPDSQPGDLCIGVDVGGGTEESAIVFATGDSHLLGNDPLYYYTRLFISSTGNVGIGTYSHVAGFVPTAKLELNSGGPGGNFSRINPGETQFTTSSSRKIKENISPIKPKGILEKIQKVQVYNYDFKKGLGENSKNKVGLMAEDFHSAFNRGSDKDINGQDVQMVLWLAVQELIKDNTSLKAQVKDLKNKLE